MQIHKAMEVGSTMNMTAEAFLAQPTLTDSYITKQEDCLPVQVPFLDASTGAGRELVFSVMNPGNPGSADWPNIYSPLDQNGNAMGQMATYDNTKYNNYGIPPQHHLGMGANATVTVVPGSWGGGGSFDGGTLSVTPEVDSQYYSDGPVGQPDIPIPKAAGTNPTSSPAPQGTCSTCEDMPDNSHCYPEALTRFIICKVKNGTPYTGGGAAGARVDQYYVVARPQTLWSFDKSNGCQRFDKELDAEDALVDDKKNTPIDVAYYDGEDIHAEKTYRTLIHSSTCDTLYHEVLAIDPKYNGKDEWTSSLSGDVEKIPLPDGGFGYYIYSGFKDPNHKARKRGGGGGGGVPTGFEEKCITICEDGEEVTGEILFKEGCDEEPTE